MVENDEIAVLEVETVELVAGGFRVHHIIVDDEGSALGVGRDALADLSVIERLVWAGSRDRWSRDATYRMGPNLPWSR